MDLIIKYYGISFSNQDRDIGEVAKGGRCCDQNRRIKRRVCADHTDFGSLVIMGGDENEIAGLSSVNTDKEPGIFFFINQNIVILCGAEFV